MKNKEDLALKCALAGGALGLVLGVMWTFSDWGSGDGGLTTLVAALLRLVLLCFSGAGVGAGFVYLAALLLDYQNKKSGVPDQSPAVIQEKTSYLHGLLTETKKSYLDISNHVTSANKHLEAAEKEFADGAFAPFWDEIEHAANELAAYKNELEHMRRTVDNFKSESNELEKVSGAPPQFQWPSHRLPDARPTAERFATVVRRAQTNFQFAVIYEQRKTNQLLYAGFGTLGAAIYSLGESISTSLDTLSKSLNTKLDKLVYQSKQHDELMKTMAARQKEQHDALDEVQQRDKPGM